MGEHSDDPPTTPIEPVQTVGSGIAARTRSRRRQRRRVVVGIAAIAALAIAGTGIAMASTRDTGATYRTATAGPGSVEQIVRSVGTVSSAAKVAASFTVAGTVAAVPVKIGDQVTAGQTLATLDPAALNNAVDAANSEITKAQDTLAKDQASQTATTSTGSTSDTGSTAGTSITGAQNADTATDSNFTGSGLRSRHSALQVRLASATAPGGGDVASFVAAVTAAQQDVLAQQQKVDTDIGTTDADIDGEKTVCGAILSSGGDGSSAGGTVTQTQTETSTQTATETQTETQTQTQTETATTTVTAPPPDTTDTGTTAAADAATVMTDAGFSQHAIATSAAIVQAAFRLADDAQPTTTSAPVSDADALSACQVAIGRVIDDQTMVSQEQADLQKLESALDDAVTALRAADQGSTGGTSGGSGGTGRTGGTGTTGGSGSGSGSGTGSAAASGSGTGVGGSAAGASGSAAGSSSSPATAEQLSADQAQIDAAQASLAVAQANVGQATLTSPLAGTVAAVAISAGQAVSASATAETITVIGPGNYQISTTVALSIVDKIKVGQPATVAVDGVNGPLIGTVAVIGALKSSTSTSSNPVYPVLITLDHTDAMLFNGAGASVSITVGKVDGVLTVPSSAIKTVGSQSTVQVLANGVPTTAAVTVGAIGNDLTQILSGITAGQQVVVADLSAALPTATTTAGAGAGVVAGLGGAGAGGAGVGGARGGAGVGGFVRPGG